MTSPVDWELERDIAVYLVGEVLGITDDDEIERRTKTTPIPECAHDIFELMVRAGYRKPLESLPKSQSPSSGWAPIDDSTLRISRSLINRIVPSRKGATK